MRVSSCVIAGKGEVLVDAGKAVTNDALDRLEPRIGDGISILSAEGVMWLVSSSLQSRVAQT